MIKNIDDQLKSQIDSVLESKISNPLIAGENYIPVTGKSIAKEDIISGIDSLLDCWLTTGRYNDVFEKKLSQYIGCKSAISVNSGSSANLNAFYALTSPSLGKRAIQKGDEVITVAAGFPTTLNPMIQFGCIPVFIDIDIPTYNIRTELIESAISEKTKAIMIAHSLGNPFDLDPILQICKKYKLWLIEDDCDSLGAEYNEKKTGSFGDLATLSF